MKRGTGALNRTAGSSLYCTQQEGSLLQGQSAAFITVVILNANKRSQATTAADLTA